MRLRIFAWVDATPATFPSGLPFSRLLPARRSLGSLAYYVYSLRRFACLYCKAHVFGLNCSPQFMGWIYRLGRMGMTQG